MSEPAPALVPIFRSQHQLAILAELFCGSESELSIAALSEALGIPQQSVSREVQRLIDHGILTTRSVGRTKLVAPNWDLPWALDLRRILTHTAGLLPQLRAALRRVASVDTALIYGSWAGRYQGEPGAFPRDVDLLVVGDGVDELAVRRVLRPLQRELGVEINPTFAQTGEWVRPSAAQRSRPSPTSTSRDRDR